MRAVLGVLLLALPSVPAVSAQTIIENEARLRALVPFERMVEISPGVTRDEYDAVMRELAEERADRPPQRAAEPRGPEQRTAERRERGRDATREARPPRPKEPVSTPPVYTAPVYRPPTNTPPVYTQNSYTPGTYTPGTYTPPTYTPPTLAPPGFAAPPRNPRVFNSDRGDRDDRNDRFDRGERAPQWFVNTATGKLCVLQPTGLVCQR